MWKKLIVCVRPGDALVRANPREFVSVFSKLDLPIFDRPQNAISGRWSRGNSSVFVALLTNRAEVIFTRGSREAGTCPHCNRRKFGDRSRILFPSSSVSIPAEGRCHRRCLAGTVNPVFLLRRAVLARVSRPPSELHPCSRQSVP